MSAGSWTPLPWQQQAWQQVSAAIRDDRVAHALLISGPRGVGKHHFVAGLAAALLCEAAAGAPRPCGACRGCVQFTAGGHPNFRELRPEEDKRDISIDAVRGLIEVLGVTSHYGGRKVAVIDPVDALNASGVNALLKTIEEPPPGSQLVLLTERLMSLTATLRSRCQILRLGAPPAALAQAWLAEKHPDVAPETRALFRRAPLRLAESLEEDWRDQRDRWREMVLDIGRGRITPALKALERIRKDEAEKLLQWLMHEATAALARKLGGDGAPSALEFAPPAVLSQLLVSAVEGLRRIAGNANPQLMMESLMIWLLQRTRPMEIR